MANTTIQIKRSTNTSIPANLASGEMAYTSNGEILYIGNPANGASIAIGGIRTPGVLTPNQAIVVDGNGAVNQITTANLTVTNTFSANTISANLLIGTVDGGTF